MLVPVYKGTGDPLVCDLYRTIKFLEQPIMVPTTVLEKRLRCLLITCSLVKYLCHFHHAASTRKH